MELYKNKKEVMKQLDIKDIRTLNIKIKE